MRIAVVVFCVCFLVSAINAAQPNVLFLAVDDLRAELGCFGQSHVHSPNIDRLASRGTLFERAYCQQTVCNPSRASLLTGMRPDTLRVWDLPTHFRQNEPDAVTLPQLFKKHGYHTRCVGKIFHNWRQDDWKGDPQSWSVPSLLHYNSHGNDQPEVEGTLPPNLASGKGGIECRDVPDDAYFDGRVAENAVLALEQISQNEKQTPFFLAVGFWKPHTPFNAPKKYWDRYDRASIPIPQRVIPPDNVPEIALTSARYQASSDSETLREMHHGHLAAISYLDAQIGKVLGKLDSLGLSENTIIVFWSDHGLHLGEHGLTRKTTAFELDARVPLIIATPRHKPNQRTGALVELLDIYPTLAELCGLDAPSVIEGVSLRPLLENPKAKWKKVALTQTPRPNYPRGKMPNVMGYSIRTDRYRYTQWRVFDTGNLQGQELYDHQTDPGETKNLAHLPEYRDVVQEHAILVERKLHQPNNAEPNARVQSEALHSASLIFSVQDRPTPSCHAASLVELPTGELAAAWFGGTNEPHLDNVILYARHTNGSWTTPVQVADGREGEDRDHRTGNPVLFQPKSGPLMLFYKVVNPDVGRASSWWGMLTTSFDNGVSWTKARRLGTSDKLGQKNPNLIGPVKNKPIMLEDGTILCASSTEHDGWKLHFEMTRDLGKTWKVIGPIPSPDGFSAIQPSFLHHGGDRIQVLCRSREGVLTQSWSKDGGASWSAITPTHVPNPNAGTDAITLADGRHLLVYNHTQKNGTFPNGRNMLNIALSKNGRSWKPVITLERAPGEYSYPAVIQTSDGFIHIAYTWKRQSIKHVAIDANKLHSIP